MHDRHGDPAGARTIGTVSAPLARRFTALAGLALSAFTFNTTENLPVGLLDLIADDLDTSLSATGSLVAVYGLIVAVTSVPLAHLGRPFPRRYVLAAVLAVLVVSTGVSATADSFPVLFGSRVATALAQAMFWAVMAPAAVGMFDARVRGKVIGTLFACGSLATVAGVPAGTWLGHQAGWRTSFVALTALSAVALTAVAACLPTARAGTGHGDVGTAPDGRRYAMLLATTTLSATGAFTAFTYVTPFLREVGGVGAGGVSALLTVFGVAGLLGVLLVGAAADRYPRLVVAAPVTGQAFALVGLVLFGADPWALALGMFALGLTAAPVYAATQGRVMHVAPRGTDVASAANSAAFNVGIAAGGGLGGLVLAVGSVRTAFVAGATVSVLATLVVGCERLLEREPTPA